MEQKECLHIRLSRFSDYVWSRPLHALFRDIFIEWGYVPSNRMAAPPICLIGPTSRNFNAQQGRWHACADTCCSYFKMHWIGIQVLYSGVLIGLTLHGWHALTTAGCGFMNLSWLGLNIKNTDSQINAVLNERFSTTCSGKFLLKAEMLHTGKRFRFALWSFLKVLPVRFCSLPCCT